MRLPTCLVLLVATSCAGYVPRPPAPVDSSIYAKADPRFAAALADCQLAIAAAYADVRHHQRLEAWLSFAGGSVAATGATASTGIAVLWQEGQGARAAARWAARGPPTP